MKIQVNDTKQKQKYSVSLAFITRHCKFHFFFQTPCLLDNWSLSQNWVHMYSTQWRLSWRQVSKTSFKQHLKNDNRFLHFCLIYCCLKSSGLPGSCSWSVRHLFLLSFKTCLKPKVENIPNAQERQKSDKNMPEKENKTRIHMLFLLLLFFPTVMCALLFS